MPDFTQMSDEELESLATGETGAFDEEEVFLVEDDGETGAFDALSLLPGGGLITQAVQGDIKSGQQARAFANKAKGIRVLGAAKAAAALAQGKANAALKKMQLQIKAQQEQIRRTAAAAKAPARPVLKLKSGAPLISDAVGIRNVSELVQMSGSTVYATQSFTGGAGNTASGNVTIAAPFIALAFDVQADDGDYDDKRLTGLTHNTEPWMVPSGLGLSIASISYKRDNPFAPPVRVLRPGDTLTASWAVDNADVLVFSVLGIPLHAFEPEIMHPAVARWIYQKTKDQTLRSMLTV